MTSYEFMQKINIDICNISAIFDSTMALYEVIGHYNGISVVDSETVEAVITYTISMDSESKIEELLNAIRNAIVTVYGITYIIGCRKVGNEVAITLQPS